METTELDVSTGTRPTTDLTAEVTRFCRGKGDGLLSVFVPHATAGVALIETGSGTEEDLTGVFNTVLPRDDRYRHRHGSVGHGADHVLPALVGPSVVIPVRGGEPLLGTWQSVVLVDLNADNPRRRVVLSFLAG